MEVVRSGRRAGRGRRPRAIAAARAGAEVRAGHHTPDRARAGAVATTIAVHRVSATEETAGRRLSKVTTARGLSVVVPGERHAPLLRHVRHHRAAQRLPRLLLRGGVSDARVHPEQVIVEQLRKIVRGVRHRTAAPSPALRQGLAPFRSPRGRFLLPSRQGIYLLGGDQASKSILVGARGFFSGPAKIGEPETKTSRPQGNSQVEKFLLDKRSNNQVKSSRVLRITHIRRRSIWFNRARSSHENRPRRRYASPKPQMGKI